MKCKDRVPRRLLRILKAGKSSLSCLTSNPQVPLYDISDEFEHFTQLQAALLSNHQVRQKIWICDNNKSIVNHVNEEACVHLVLTFSMTNVHSLSSNSSAWGSYKQDNSYLIKFSFSLWPCANRQKTVSELNSFQPTIISIHLMTQFLCSISPYKLFALLR